MPTIRQTLTALVSRRYPLLSGCGALANSRLVEIAAGKSSELAWVQLDCGTKLLVPMQDFVGKAIYYIGDLDPKVTQTIRRIVRSGDTVLDIGANMGLVTMRLSALVGPH